MCRKAIVGVCALLCLAARTVTAQTWASTDVGDVGAAGQVVQNGSSWTVAGSGADIWGTADAFQFVHGPGSSSGYIVARVDSLDNTNPFAKAGVMLRTGLDADAPAAILDVRPTGDVEFMYRLNKGDAMQFYRGAHLSFPVWLRLGWDFNKGIGLGAMAWISSDGDNWTSLESVPFSSQPFEVGLVVTSHDAGVLATAHFSDVARIDTSVPGWNSADVGAIRLVGSAGEQLARWTVSGAGADIWGSSDAFRYVYRYEKYDGKHIVARIDDQLNTNTFAKTGVMLRSSVDAGAPTVLLDVRPTGDVEFMQRTASGTDMQFMAGTHVTLPVWVQLEWEGATVSHSSAMTMVTASVSQDKIHWQTVGDPVPYLMPPLYTAGLAVTSHDVTQLNVAHVGGLSLLPADWWSDDIGAGAAGSASIDNAVFPSPIIAEATGSDIWGTADSFEFVHAGVSAGDLGVWVNVQGSNPFAKAGLMYRDGLDPSAASVILDFKPDGGVEFMARLCAGCATTFIGGAQFRLPSFLQLSRNGSDFSARAWSNSPSGPDAVDLGVVTVPMSTPIYGYAVTSHDLTQTANGSFSNPPR